MKSRSFTPFVKVIIQKKKEVEMRAYKALKMVGIEDEYFYQSPFALSGGQKRRVAIAGVLAMEPEVLVLDEPTAGLDPKGRDEVLEPLLHYRMNENLPTFFTSNLTLEELEKHFVVSNTSIDMINARRVIERIKKLSEPVLLVSKNIRE